MTPVTLKNLLDSFVEPRHRMFEIRFEAGKPRKMIASYLRKRRLITIYIEHFQSPLDGVGAGLHELAHHLTWECNSKLFTGKTVQEIRRTSHGKEFRRLLRSLVDKFNSRYSTHLDGILVFNRLRPRYAPGFVKFSEILQRIRYGSEASPV